MFDKSIKKLEKHRNDILWFEISFFCVFLIAILLSMTLTDVRLWGDKTETLFDVWFVQHTFSGMIVSFFLLSLCRIKKYSLIILIVGAFLWEYVEFFLETDSHSAVMIWMAGLEHPLNRFVFDPFAAILGFILINRFPRWISICLLFNISFAVLHLWLGDSMAVQKFLY